MEPAAVSVSLGIDGSDRDCQRYQREAKMATGKVLWFNPVMGHGYIEPVDGPAVVPVVQHAVELAGYKTLKAGQVLRYELARGIDGKIRASSLRLLD
jgi:CspA family cold shock protein